jgi:hypothetical protein
MFRYSLLASSNGDGAEPTVGKHEQEAVNWAE